MAIVVENSRRRGRRTDNLSGSPLYSRLASELRARIARGAYRVGGVLPTEAELCAEFGVSRYTVREALRRLVDLGLVARKQGSGSEIIASRPPEAFVQSMRSLSELFQYALDTRFVIETLAPVMLDADAAALVPGKLGSTWLRIAGVRHQATSAHPICYTIVYCAARFSPLAEEMRATRGPIYALIEARTSERIAEAVQEISALPMPREIAEALGAKVRAPAMRIVRRYLGADSSPILTSVNWHPAERFVYRMRLKRDRYRQLD